MLSAVLFRHVCNGRVLGNPRILRTIRTISGYDTKYSEKLNQRAKELGLSLEELKAQVKQQQAEDALQRRRREKQADKEGGVGQKGSEATCSTPMGVRKDSSPVKPLSSLFNLQKVVETPHSGGQIESLWTAYHLAKAGGTGRGYVSASIPLTLYQKMERTARKYPSFIVPIPRGSGKEGDQAYEFFYLQWDFHDHPPRPDQMEDVLGKRVVEGESQKSNPQTSTVLFTPMVEYKMRGTFATPYLVLTNYTDLARTHNIVLMRGEITPAAASGARGGEDVEGRYMLTQKDGQVLSMALQRFYLWEDKEGEKWLKCFHETPSEFKWEELVKYIYD